MSKYADDLYRRQFAPVIARVIAACPHADESRLRMYLHDERFHCQALSTDAVRAWNLEVAEQMAARGGKRERLPAAQPGNLFGE